MASVLVVDDHRRIVNSLERSLRKAEHEVTKAYSEKEATELLNREHFDVVVTDLKMETDTSGIEVLKKAKELDPFIEVIVLTAYGAVETAVPAMKQGAFDYVEKSTEIDDGVDVYDKIVETVHEAVVHRSAHKREIKESAGKSILDELTKSEVLSFPQLFAEFPFPSLTIRKALAVLLEAGKIKTWIDPKTEVEMYQRRYSGWWDKTLSLISQNS